MGIRFRPPVRRMIEHTVFSRCAGRSWAQYPEAYRFATFMYIRAYIQACSHTYNTYNT